MNTVKRKTIIISVFGLLAFLLIFWIFVWSELPNERAVCHMFSKFSRQYGETQVDAFNKVKSIKPVKKFSSPSMQKYYNVDYYRFSSNGDLLLFNKKYGILLMVDLVVENDIVNWSCTGYPEKNFSKGCECIYEPTGSDQID